MERESHQYDDILYLPHHTSKTRPRMPMHDRAAQFSSFAALVGFDRMIEEEERLTEQRIELDETQKEILDEKLCLIEENIASHPFVSVLYFLPDTYKDGGAYVTVSGNIKKIDAFYRKLVFSNGSKIPIDDIRDINCELFSSAFFEY